MSQMLDWGKLVSQGRAKAPGISWSNEEGIAVAKIAQATGKTMAEVAPYVRKGILTLEAFEKAQSNPDTVNPFLKLSKDDLLKKAQAMGINASTDATKEVLAQIILEKKQNDIVEAKAKAEEEKKAEEEAKDKTEPEEPKEPEEKPASKLKAKPVKKAGRAKK